MEFLNRPELRPVRMQLELLKPEMTLIEEGVGSTIVLFGGTQILEEDGALARLEAARASAEKNPEDAKSQRDVLRAERCVAKAKFYDDAREFSRLVSSTCQKDGRCDYVVVTGGGPGIMEAGNRGAYEIEAKSIGLNITLPDEQAPNPYITPELCFQFDYFALRKNALFDASQSVGHLSRRIWDSRRIVQRTNAATDQTNASDTHHPLWIGILAEGHRFPVSCGRRCDPRRTPRSH